MSEVINKIRLAQARRLQDKARELTEKKKMVADDLNDSNKDLGVSEMEGKKRLNIARIKEERKDEEQKSAVSRMVYSSEEAAVAFSKASTGPKWKAFIEAVKLAFEYRKKIADYDNSPFIIILLLSVAADFADFLPIAGWVISLFAQPVLIISLWGRGRLKKKIALKIIFLILMFLEVIPGIDLLPLNVITTVWIWHQSAKEAGEAKKGLAKLEEEFSLS